MFGPMIRMATVAAVAATIALAVTAAPAASDDAVQPHAFAPIERLPVTLKATKCSMQGWPNIEPKCQFDRREPAGEARIVRIIAMR